MPRLIIPIIIIGEDIIYTSTTPDIVFENKYIVLFKKEIKQFAKKNKYLILIKNISCCMFYTSIHTLLICLQMFANNSIIDQNLLI